MLRMRDLRPLGNSRIPGQYSFSDYRRSVSVQDFRRPYRRKGRIQLSVGRKRKRSTIHLLYGHSVYGGESQAPSSNEIRYKFQRVRPLKGISLIQSLQSCKKSFGGF